MKLPNGEHAVVESRKLIEYVLNVEHPVGRHHALLFNSLLGITPADVHLLEMALRKAAKDGEAAPGKSSPFGQKWEVRFSMPGPRGAKNVLSVWLVASGHTIPRLITCYVE